MSESGFTRITVLFFIEHINEIRVKIGRTKISIWDIKKIENFQPIRCSLKYTFIKV